MAPLLLSGLKFIVFGSLFGASTSALVASSTLDVRLTSGSFRGLSVPNGTERWLGIPFAKPPVGPLRFKAPVPITTPSPVIKDAVNFGDACPQIPDATLHVPQSEDCLTLNVRG